MLLFNASSASLPSNYKSWIKSFSMAPNTLQKSIHHLCHKLLLINFCLSVKIMFTL